MLAPPDLARSVDEALGAEVADLAQEHVGDHRAERRDPDRRADQHRPREERDTGEPHAHRAMGDHRGRNED